MDEAMKRPKDITKTELLKENDYLRSMVASQHDLMSEGSQKANEYESRIEELEHKFNLTSDYIETLEAHLHSLWEGMK